MPLLSPSARIGVIEHNEAGEVRALAVTTRHTGAAPHSELERLLAGLRGKLLGRIWYPKNTPAEIIGKLNNAINAALANPKIKARLADLGGTTLAGSSAAFGKLVAEKPRGRARRSGRLTSSRIRPSCLRDISSGGDEANRDDSGSIGESGRADRVCGPLPSQRQPFFSLT